MSKSDELRRMREARFAGRAPAAQPAVLPAPASVAEDAAPSPTRRGVLRSGRPRDAAEEQGKCPACGKMRSLQNGVVTVHQKGFGKICPGSRQAPA